MKAAPKLRGRHAAPAARPGGKRGPHVNFAAVNRAALARLPELLARWVPDGKQIGHEYVAKNPTRVDRRAGSFKVNINTGRWADFASGDRGGDVVSLAAYLARCSQVEAARQLATALRLGDGC